MADDVENNSNGENSSLVQNEYSFEGEMMESNVCVDRIYNVDDTICTLDGENFSDSDWVDGEKFFRSMDDEVSITTNFWVDDNEKEKESSFVAESFGEGDWVTAEDILKKKGEEDDILRFHFGYDNTDCYMESIAELYTYSEVPEFDFNMSSFEDVLKELKISNPWQLMSLDERDSIILYVIELLDVVDSECRTKAKSTLLYIAQGCWREIKCLKDQQEWAIYNISLLMKNGVFDSMLEVLYFEVEKNQELVEARQLRTKMGNMVDSYALRLTLNLLYTMLETVRCNRSLHSFLPCIKAEISEESGDKKLLATLLLDMLGDFGRRKEYSHYPVKKIALLLWKVILISLGGEKELRQLRNERRAHAGLPPEENSGRDSEDSQEKMDSKLNRSKITKKEMDDYFEKISEKYLGHAQSVLKDENVEFLFPLCIKEVLNTLEKNVFISLADVQKRFEEKKISMPFTYNEELECIDATEALYTSMLPNVKDYAIGITKILCLVAPSTSWRSISEVVPPQRSGWMSTDNVIRNIDATRYKEILFKAISTITLLLLKHTKVNHFLQFEHLSQELVKCDAILGFFAFFKVESLVYILKQNYRIERYNFPNCLIGDLPEVTIDEIRTRSLNSHCRRSALFGYINAVRILNKLTKGKPHRGIYMARHYLYHNFMEALKIKEPTFQHYIIKLLKLQMKYAKGKCKSEDRKRFNLAKLSLLTEMYGKVRTNLTDEKWFYFSDEDYNRFRDFRCSYLVPSTQNLLRRFHRRKYKVQTDNDVFPDYASDCSSVSFNKDDGEEELFKKNYEQWLDLEVFNNPIDWDQFLKEDSHWK